MLVITLQTSHRVCQRLWRRSSLRIQFLFLLVLSVELLAVHLHIVLVRLLVSQLLLLVSISPSFLPNEVRHEKFLGRVMVFPPSRLLSSLFSLFHRLLLRGLCLRGFFHGLCRLGRRLRFLGGRRCRGDIVIRCLRELDFRYTRFVLPSHLVVLRHF